MPRDCDVLILGAGPAGSALAAHLASAGFAVRLADRKAFPRPKPCGEFLSPQCGPLLTELGVDLPLRERGMRTVHGLHLHGFGRRAAGRFRALSPGQPARLAGFGVRREVLDWELLSAARAAGAEWLPRHAVHRLQRNAAGQVCGADLVDGAGVVHPVRARWVVGADGLRSTVARELGWHRPIPWLDRFALVAHFQDVALPEVGEVHLFPGGYFAATAVDAGLFSVNLVVDRAALRDRGGDWDDFVAERLRLAPAFATRVQGGTRIAPWRGVGPLAGTTVRQTAPGVALVGDAAGYVDPLTGEGVYFALWGARTLADSLAQALHRPAAGDAALRAWQRSRRRELGPRLLLARWLQRGLGHPWLLRTLLSACAAQPRLCDLLVTLTGDTIHPRDLLRPSLWRALLRRQDAA